MHFHRYGKWVDRDVEMIDVRTGREFIEQRQVKTCSVCNKRKERTVTA